MDRPPVYNATTLLMCSLSVALESVSSVFMQLTTAFKVSNDVSVNPLMAHGSAYTLTHSRDLLWAPVAFEKQLNRSYSTFAETSLVAF